MRRRPGRLISLLAVLASLAAACLSLPSAAEELYWSCTVRPGDNIWNLTEKHTTSVLNWKRIQRLNGIPDGPDRQIRPGTTLRFPIDILKHQPVSATVVQQFGPATLQRADGSEQAVQVSTRLHSGDRLLLGKDSNLTIRFADGSELLVLGGSEIVMDSLSAYGETGMVDTRVRLQGGQVDTRVRPGRGPGSRYEIITPAAVAAVRGTDFRVSAETGRPVARSEVLEGRVAVAGDGASQLVPAGYGLVAESGKPPEKPRPLLPAPDLSPQVEVLDRLPLQFNWSALSDAGGYRFQIATSEAFDSLLANATTPGTRGFWPDLPDGDYVLRVRGIDADGLEGLNAMRGFTVAAHPEPPTLLSLLDGVLVRDATPEFGWSRPQDISRYHLQVARDPAFGDILLDRPGYGKVTYTPDSGLGEGRYHWRVASIDAGGKQGPWSDAASFEYRAVPGMPEVEAPALGDDELAFRWRSAGEGLDYQFQFGTDPEFGSVLIDRIVDEPGIRIDRPAAELYHFRVRAIDDTGYAGPWSTVQSLEVPGSIWTLLAPFGLLLLL
jgi:hypothetical protein